MITFLEKWIATMAAGVAVASTISLIVVLLSMVSDRGRDGMDPPPGLFSPFMPLIRIFSFYITSNFSDDRLIALEERLQHRGVSFMVTAEEFFAGQISLAFVFICVAGIAMSTGQGVNWFLLVVLGGLGAILPELWMTDYKRRRDEELVRNLPIYLEYLTMCVDAGLNFAGAMQQAVDKGPKGAMRNEFRIVLRDINSGYTRADSLTRFEQRVDLSDISVFVRAIIQSDKLGSSMKDTLAAQAKQRLSERFQRAEKSAMEAPVKLVVPLVVFIFPLTFIMLLFPIVMKFSGEGSF